MYTQHEIAIKEHLLWWRKLKSSRTRVDCIYQYEGIDAGVVSLTEIDDSNSTASWAFYAAPDAAKGTGSRMEFLALEYALVERGLHKLCCEVLSFITGVVAMHKKFGFRLEGLLRDQKRINGAYVDVCRFGILQDEWATNRQAMEDTIIRRLK